MHRTLSFWQNSRSMQQQDGLNFMNTVVDNMKTSFSHQVLQQNLKILAREKMLQEVSLSTQGPTSAVDKVQLFLWAPSKHLNDKSFVEVLRFVFGDTSGVVFTEDIRKMMFSSSYSSSQSQSHPTNQQEPSTLLKFLHLLQKRTATLNNFKGDYWYSTNWIICCRYCTTTKSKSNYVYLDSHLSKF